MHVVTCTQCCKDFWTDISQICSTCDAHNKTAEAGQKLADACRNLDFSFGRAQDESVYMPFYAALEAWDKLKISESHIRTL